MQLSRFVSSQIMTVDVPVECSLLPALAPSYPLLGSIAQPDVSRTSLMMVKTVAGRRRGSLNHVGSTGGSPFGADLSAYFEHPSRCGRPR